MQEVLVDRGQFVAQNGIEKLEDLGVTLHENLLPEKRSYEQLQCRGKSIREKPGLTFGAANLRAGDLGGLIRVGLRLEHLADERHAFSALGLDAKGPVESGDRT
jgi:hypothetical protein